MLSAEVCPAIAARRIDAASSGNACKTPPSGGGGGAWSDVPIVGWNNVERRPRRAAN
jgi:hypothetical protein